MNINCPMKIHKYKLILLLSFRNETFTYQLYPSLSETIVYLNSENNSRLFPLEQTAEPGFFISCGNSVALTLILFIT